MSHKKYKMEKSELIELFEEFLNQSGMWCNFKVFVEKQGYTTTELGFEE